MLMNKFGRTGLECSVLGFGCMRLPLTDKSDAASIDEKQATAMLRQAIEGGVNYVDTAYTYHCATGRDNPGASEPFVGRALSGGWREKVHLATKLPSWLVTSRAQMDGILDDQLRRLQTDRVDCYLVHCLNATAWANLQHLGIVGFLDKAKKSGKIRFAGFSFHDRYDAFETILASYGWDFAQIQYNYLDIDYQAGRKGLDLAASRGVPIVVMEPLRGGFLTDHMPAAMKELLAAARPGRSLAGWGLRWVMAQPGVAVVLSGMSAPAQVAENLQIAGSLTPVTAEEENALAAVRDYFHSRLKANCTGCGYCLPCENGVNIPKNFLYYNDYFLVDSDVTRARAKYAYTSQVVPEERAGNCVACGQCETHCPQKLPISRLMEDVKAVLCGGK